MNEFLLAFRLLLHPAHGLLDGLQVLAGLLGSVNGPLLQHFQLGVYPF